MIEALRGLCAYVLCRLSLLIGGSPLFFFCFVIRKVQFSRSPVVSEEQGHVLL